MPFVYTRAQQRANVGGAWGFGACHLKLPHDSTDITGQEVSGNRSPFSSFRCIDAGPDRR
jgi:hypothetical protein